MVPSIVLLYLPQWTSISGTILVLMTAKQRKRWIVRGAALMLLLPAQAQCFECSRIWLPRGGLQDPLSFKWCAMWWLSNTPPSFFEFVNNNEKRKFCTLTQPLHM